MFSSYNFKEFGNYLRTIRKMSNMTQLEVSKLTGIHIDSIRRIENASVIPKYETLEILSAAYKTDLMTVMSKFKTDKTINDLVSILDNVLVTYDKDKTDKINQISDLIHNYTTQGLINISEHKQLISFITASAYYHSKEKNEIKNHIINLSKTLVLSVPNFNIDNYSLNNYQSFELSILLLIGILYKNDSELIKSNEILDFCLKQLLIKENTDNLSSQNLIVKVYYNISYNYYKMQDDLNALHYADLGICYSIEKSSFYCLALLYARKATAQLYLGIEGYLRNYKKAISLLYILDENEHAKQMRIITKEIHNINLDSLDLSLN